MVKAIEPKLGETIFDPAWGTGGFLVEAYEYLKQQCGSQEWKILQKSITGGEAKSLPLIFSYLDKERVRVPCSMGLSEKLFDRFISK